VVESPAATGSARTPESTERRYRRFRSFSHLWPGTCLAHSHAIYRHAGVHELLLITEPVPVTLVSIGLEGKLLGAWVEEARQIVASARASNRVCLNLQGLTFADSRGIELLRTLRQEGIPLLGCSPLIEGLLAADEAAAIAVPGRIVPSHDE
jgi:hypothetical protein